MAAGWAFSLWPGFFSPAGESAAPLNLGIACLADAHLRDGNDKCPEARGLARAVAAIRALNPAPDLVLFAGDLAHDGDPGALALGREILADLPAPLLAVPGEGDGGLAGGGPWRRLFYESPFLYSFKGMHLLGLATTWQPTAWGPAFALGEEQNRWLAAKLPRLEPTKPLVVLSHAPLEPVFRPWGQWTVDSNPLLGQLAQFPHVLCLNGHMHQAELRGQGLGVSNCITGFSNNSPLAENRELKTENLSIPSTAWPLPQALLGTPRKLRPGLGPRGCGWLLVSGDRGGWAVEPRSWLA